MHDSDFVTLISECFNFANEVFVRTDDDKIAKLTLPKYCPEICQAQCCDQPVHAFVYIDELSRHGVSTDQVLKKRNDHRR